jgi:hypothetical protein
MTRAPTCWLMGATGFRDPHLHARQHGVAWRDCGWCWTGVAGWGRVAPQGITDDIALLVIARNGTAPTLSNAPGFVADANSRQAIAPGTTVFVCWCRATSSAMTGPTMADGGPWTATVARRSSRAAGASEQAPRGMSRRATLTPSAALWSLCQATPRRARTGSSSRLPHKASILAAVGGSAHGRTRTSDGRHGANRPIDRPRHWRRLRRRHWCADGCRSVRRNDRHVGR